ncbi:hypothetical protein BW13_07825 [Bifidobacterium sp. UTCIF-37]|uniref:hypothetical protein n=1 Tax=unclassified Bifidobacterium TaxID=2608897 RepID=UPI00112A81A2|nr:MULTISPECIES: hypothetical protein [unclassified Bifidobacterium]TPF86108.1 hypothetical protein BW13_07825 [Bifidobacterium sp. UTCIF-37]TPF88167.1 hypothetical protein BW11_07960 [Bifidobacterium sp. UTCIF-38]
MSLFKICAGWPRFFAAICALVMLVAVGGCSNEKSDGSGSTGTDSSAVDNEGQSGDQLDEDYELVGSGQKKADSLNAYIDQILSYPETSDSAREILTRAKANGGVTVSDYERTWMNYKQCLLDKGYKEIILNKYPNGIYEEAAYYANGTPSQIQKFDQDRQLCFKDVGPVNEVFSMQQGNPNLAANVNEAIVDCLHRNNLVPKEYTAKQYAAERAEGDLKAFSINVKDPGVRGCEVANSVFASYPVDKLEHPF